MRKIRDNIVIRSAALLLVGLALMAQDAAPPEPAAPAAPVVRPSANKRTTAPQTRTSPAAARRSALNTRGAHGGLAARRAPQDLEPGTTTIEPDDGREEKTEDKTALKFEDAASDFLLRAYADETGKTLLISPDVPKVSNINLRSQEDVELTPEEYLEAIEVTLNMHGIVLEPYGDKFLKVLPRKTIRAEGIKILMEAPEGGHPEKNRVVSQMIQLKHITISEAQKALEGFKRPDGMMQAFERTNSLLVTDTQENVNRMLEIVHFIDQPLLATEEVNVRMIRFAKADDIKKRLEEIVAESQKQTQAKEEIKPNVSGAPGFTRAPASAARPATGRPMPPGLSRLGARGAVAPAPAPVEPNVPIETLVSDADRGMIRGKVQIIADERSNQLIIITREENMNFFDKIITVLDVETAPDVLVEVQRLEYADAEEVSAMLNDLIGNVGAGKKDDSAPKTGAQQPAAGTPEARSASLSEAVAARTSRRTATTSEPGSEATAKLGHLSKDNIKILADKRTNAIVIMGSPNDVKAIKEIIASMDIKLSQVLIETTVIQVNLGDDLRTGVDWILGKQSEGYQIKGKDQEAVYKDGVVGQDDEGNDIMGKVLVSAARGAADYFAGGGGSTALSTYIRGDQEPLDAAANMISPGVNYLLKSEKLNISAMITAAKTDTRAKVLSSPILMTVDNKEATLEATQMRYLYKGVRYSGSTNEGREVPDYEQRDIGLTVKITPRINPNGAVVLTIDETFETIGAPQKLGGEEYPTINTRKVQADIAVENMQTVVLGGLVQSEVTESKSGVPLLQDIPFIGKYLFSSLSQSETRSELVVFITPYVLDSKEELEAEAERRKKALHDARPWDDGGWSKSALADPLSRKQILQRAKREWKAEDADLEAASALEKAERKRAEAVLERDKRDAERKLRQAQDDLRAAERRAEEEYEQSTTEDQLRILLNKLKEERETTEQTPLLSAPESQPTLSVSESVEVLENRAAAPIQEPKREPTLEKLLK